MMEAGDCMKEMFKAVKQYVGNPSDNNLSKLNRNIYGLIALTHDSVSSVFNPRDALTMQCMSCLIDILDGAVVPDLFERIIVLLTKLVEDDSQCKLLTERYSLTNVLSILCIHKLSDSIQLLTKCLCLLQKITYINKVRFEDGFVDELVKFIIQFIPTNSLNVDNQQLCRVCVCLLANVCRNNLPVQTYVKNLRNIKQIYKTLVGFIAIPNKDFNIPSLSVLTCLYLHDDIGQNFFSPVNINQTFLLIFNVLVSSEPERSRKYAIDLVIDLIRHPHISDLLVSFQHLELTVKQVLNLLKSKALLDAGKLFELLLAFCSVSKLRSVVCRCVFESKDSEIHLIESIMAWIKQSSSPLSVLALSLVRELYEVLVYYKYSS
ncbi:protein CIP2A-like [Tubulanus polymorphus]|uniref:protein CIP2A-like n=1 Tax=Tubulanus polymorphus TaxID=672921 RepID=UPI003DA58305